MKKGIAKVNAEIRREETRQATFNIIANQGVKGLTISAIVDRVGVSQANLYRHFKNKKEILAHAVESIGKGFLQNLSSVQQCQEYEDNECREEIKKTLQTPSRIY